MIIIESKQGDRFLGGVRSRLKRRERSLSGFGKEGEREWFWMKERSRLKREKCDRF